MPKATLAMTMKRLAYSFVLLAVGGQAVWGQGPTIAAGGYTQPNLIRVAPGQLITLFVRGIRGPIPNGVVRATSLPLPTSLAGISVTLRQPVAPPNPIPVPLFLVSSTQIWVQIPFELVPGRITGPPDPAFDASLVVTENGVAGDPVFVNPRNDNVHILRICDTLAPTRLFDPSFCGLPVIIRGNEFITSGPVKAGDVLVLYAFGLGITAPLVRTGFAAAQSGARRPRHAEVLLPSK